MRKVLVALVFAVLAGCASVAKMEAGPQSVGERMMVSLGGAWNHVQAPGMGPAQVWTMEGLPVDQLLLYAGIKDGETIHARGGGANKEFAFRSGMQPEQVVAMFEGMLTRDGSSFRLLKLEPAAFGGGKGYRFEYSLVRRIDAVQLSGVGFATISNGELFALLYQAPRMTFFPRHKDNVEGIARSARFRT
jgi:hypothetical protein